MGWHEKPRRRLLPVEVADSTGAARANPSCDARPVQLNHVALTVSDRDRSADFYGRHFAMKERVHDDEHLVILASSDGSLLALSEGQVPAGLPRTNHFGFQVEPGTRSERHASSCAKPA